jgi:hypothetical protein
VLGRPRGEWVLCSPDLEARRKRFTGVKPFVRTGRSRVPVAAALAVTAILVAGCGGGERQDENEPEGNFDVWVVSAMFPKQQKLAKSSDLVITVRNVGDEVVPNLAVTVEGLSFRSDATGVSNPERPQFAVNGRPREIGGYPDAKEATPLGCDTAYVSTWACGPLRPGREKTFVWSVTAVKAGPYKIRWRVAAGLDGKAKAVARDTGEAPSGSFSGTVSDEPPDVRVAADGETVVRGTR